ncbi:unnamed protein product [Amaranthus hypochondriacus]
MTHFLFILFLSLAASTTADYFRDSTGKPVVNGGSYSMARDMMAPDEGPITWGKSNHSRSSCPLNVIQSHYDMNPDVTNNIPYTSITFRSPLKSKFIPVGTPIDIYFNTRDSPCKKSLKWSVKPAKAAKSFDLVAGDKNPRYKGSFKVVIPKNRNDYVYRLMFCFKINSCLEVGNSHSFYNWEVLGITFEPKKNNFWALDFVV